MLVYRATCRIAEKQPAICCWLRFGPQSVLWEGERGLEIRVLNVSISMTVASAPVSIRKLTKVFLTLMSLCHMSEFVWLSESAHKNRFFVGSSMPQTDVGAKQQTLSKCPALPHLWQLTLRAEHC